MSDPVGSSRLVTYEQAKTLIDFMGMHVEFASGNVRTLEARYTSKRLWGELTKTLNESRGGAWKTADGWSKHWSDFKNKLKNKVRLLRRNKSSASKKGIKPLTALEKRALVILGPHFDKKFRNKTHNDTSTDPLPPEVKLESYHENSTNEFCKTNDIGNRSSGGGRNSDESSESSSEEYVANTDPITDEPLIHSLYPKWLIEVERKRAEADLLRAKAEEQRAVAAERSAEAALVQAEALKKLSEAATTQAEALTRIATVLEDREHRDILSI